MAIVASNHAYVTGGDSIVALLEAKLQHAAVVARSLAMEQQQNLVGRMQARAAQDPLWAPVAGDIGRWTDPEGLAAFGVPDDHPRAQQAITAEFGDRDNAPSGFIRMSVAHGAFEVGWGMTEGFRRAGY